MAQHDYVIDNSTGANVRADINSVLQAIASNNSGSSAPSTTYALQSFANTTDSMLQLRNSANNAFVNLRKFDGTLPLPDGSASSPSLFFDDDTNTGLFSSAADTFNVATGGVERLELGATTIFNESGADVDFRIEGDTQANLFYVDAGNNRIGIRTSSPDSILDVVHTDVSVTAGSNDIAVFRKTNEGYLKLLSDNAGVGGVAFGDTDDNFIGAIRYDHGDDALEFIINNGEKARIDSSGRLLIGGSTNVSTGGIEGSLQILGTGSDDASVNLARFSNNIHPSFLCFSKSRNGTLGGNTIVQDNDRLGVIAFFGSDGTDLACLAAEIECEVDGTPAVDNMPGKLIFKTTASGTSPAERMIISSNGNIGAPSGSNIFNASDSRVKTNVVNLEKGLSDIKSLRPVSFNWIDGFCDEEKNTLYGFIAQEVQTVDSNLIQDFSQEITVKDTKIENVLRVNEKFMIPMLVKAIQELSAKVEALEAA